MYWPNYLSKIIFSFILDKIENKVIYSNLKYKTIGTNFI